ncbi:zinc finger, CCHC-type containing protein [Tanacetum coccineum]
MFELNNVNDNIGPTFMSTFKLNNLILRHARLGRVHYKRMQDMSTDGLILAFDMDTEKTRDEVSDQHSYCFNVEDGPKTFNKAIKSQDVAFWKESINDEMDSIVGNNTWVLDDLPLALASIHGLIIHQMDVKSSVLNSELEEEVYMNQLQGFIMPGNKNKVCKLIKSIYGLKQALKQCKFEESSKGGIICLYVDEILIFGTNKVQVDTTKEFFSSKFSKKDIGEVDVILMSTLIDTSEKLMANNGQAVFQLEYSRVIGCLIELDFELDPTYMINCDLELL